MKCYVDSISEMAFARSRSEVSLNNTVDKANHSVEDMSKNLGLIRQLFDYAVNLEGSGTNHAEEPACQFKVDLLSKLDDVFDEYFDDVLSLIATPPVSAKKSSCVKHCESSIHRLNSTNYSTVLPAVIRRQFLRNLKPSYLVRALNSKGNRNVHLSQRDTSWHFARDSARSLDCRRAP